MKTLRVVEVRTVEDPAPDAPVGAALRILRTNRYAASSVGAALDAHAPDPAPGAVFQIRVIGAAEVVE